MTHADTDWQATPARTPRWQPSIDERPCVVADQHDVRQQHFADECPITLRERYRRGIREARKMTAVRSDEYLIGEVGRLSRAMLTEREALDVTHVDGSGLVAYRLGFLETIVEELRARAKVGDVIGRITAPPTPLTDAMAAGETPDEVANHGSAR